MSIIGRLYVSGRYAGDFGLLQCNGILVRVPSYRSMSSLMVQVPVPIEDPYTPPDIFPVSDQHHLGSSRNLIVSVNADVLTVVINTLETSRNAKIGLSTDELA